MLKKRLLLISLTLILGSVKAFALTCTSKATGNWNSAATWGGCGNATPGNNDTAIISSHTVTLNVSTTVTNLEISTPTNSGVFLNQNNNVVMTITGYAKIHKSSSSISAGWNINAGTATVGGLITFASTRTQIVGISSITITSGELDANGGLTFLASTAPTNVIYMNTATAMLKLKGALSAPANSGTLSATNGTFNYVDTAAQTVSSFPAGNYFNLYLNNTHANGATLGFAITPTLVTGDIIVQQGVFKNGGLAIQGLAARTFQVASGASFEMSGASAYPTSFGTYTYGATSNVRYLQTTNPLTISTATYGNLELKPASAATQVFSTGTYTVQGNLTLGDGVNAARVTANPAPATVVVTGTMTIAAISNFNFSTTSFHTIGGDFVSVGSFTATLSTIAFNSSNSGQFIRNKGLPFGNIVSSNTNSGGLQFTSSFTASQLFMNTGTLGSAATIYFAGNSTATISNFNINGAASLPAVLRSTTTGTYWYLNNTTQNNVTYVDVKDSNASQNIAIDDYFGGVNSLNNVNWNFNVDQGKRYWIATAAGNWNSTSNWSLRSGGVGGAQVPLSTHTVIFDGAASDNGDCKLFNTVAVTTLTISGYTGAFNTQSYDITISSYFTQSSGSVILGTSVVTLQGDMIRSGGNFSAGTSTLSFTGNLNQTLTPNATSFAYMVVSKSANQLTLGGGLTLEKNLTIQNGTLNTSAANNYYVTVASDVVMSGGTFNLNNSTMIVSGSWSTPLGTLSANSSTVTFNSAAAKTILSGGENFAHLIFSGSGSWTLQDQLTATGNLNLTAGTLDSSSSNFGILVSSDVLINGGSLTLNSSTMSIGGAWTRTLGTFNSNFSTVTFNSNGAKTIFSGGQSFSHLNFSGTGSWALQDQLSATGNLTLTNGTVNTSATNYGILVSSDVRLNGGTFTLNNSTMIVTGNWTATTGTLNANSSTITFNSDAAKTILSSGKSFAHLIFSGAGSWTLQDQLLASGNLTTTAGTLNSSSNDYGILVSSDVLINGGTLTLNSSTMSVGGAWARTSGNFNPNFSTVTFNSAATKSINIGGVPFTHVRFNGSGQWNLAAALYTSGNLTLDNGTLTTGNNFNITVASDVVLNGGTFTLNSSSMSAAKDWSRTATVINAGGSTVTFAGALDSHLTGSSTFYSLNCVIAGKNLTFESNSTQTVTGILTLTGGAGNPILLRASTPGTYAYLKSPVNHTVSYVDVQDSNASAGVTVRNLTGGVNTGHNINWAFADSARYWVASSQGLWNSSANWSLASGGVGGMTVPTSTHTVIFDGVNGSNGNAIVNTAFTITTMTIAGYSGLLNINGYAVTIASALNQSSGQLSLSTSVVTLQGDMTLSGGGFTAGGSTLSFTGGLNQTLIPNGTSFMNVLVSKSGNSLTLGGDLSVLGNLTVTLGTLNTGGSNYSVSVSSDVLINGGTLTLNSSTMSVSGAWTRSSGSFNANSSTVTFNSATTKSINIGGLPFAHVRFNGTGQWNLAAALFISGNLTLDNGTLTTANNFNITVGSNVYLNGGTFTLNNSSMSVADDWSRTSTVINAGASTVTFTGASPANLTGSSTFYSLTSIVAGKNLTFESNSTQTVTGLLTLTGANGNPIILRASDLGTYAYLKNSGGNNVTYVDVQDSNASAGVTIRDFTGGVNQGNNNNWSFTDSSRYWIASSPAFWNSTANWSLTSGGSGGASVPGSTHTVVFDGVNGKNGNATVNTPFTITTMTISGYSGVVDFYGYSVTIASALNQSSGQLSFSTSVVTLQGDMTLSGGGLTVGGSTLAFTGGLNQTLTTGGTSFMNVQVSKSGNSLTLSEDLSVLGNLTVTLGTLNTSGNNYSVSVSSDVLINGGTLTLNSSTMSVGGAWARTLGTFNANFSTITFNSSTAKAIRSGGQSFSHLDFSGSGSWALQDQLSATGNLSLTNGTVNTSATNYGILVSSDVRLNGGTFTLNNSTMIVTGNWTTTAGTLNANSSTITFNSSGPKTILSAGGSFSHVIFNNLNGTWTLQDQLRVAGNLTLSSGTLNSNSNNYGIAVTSDVILTSGIFTLNSSTMSVGGAWTRTLTLVNPNSSTVTFNSNIARTLNFGGLPLNHVVFNGVGPWTLGSALFTSGNLSIDNGTLNTGANLNITVGGSVYLNDGTFTLNNSSMSVADDWSRTSTVINAGASTVTFTGASPANLTGSSTFYSLTSIVAGKNLTFESNSTQTVTGLLTLTGANGNPIILRASDLGTYAYLKNSGGNNVTYVDVQDSNASAGVTIRDFTGGVNQGNNNNWSFTDSSRYWIASSPAFWNSTANWSLTSGGSGGASVPGSTHTVVFDGVNGKNGNATVNTPFTITTMTISGYSGVVDFYGYSVTIASALNQSSGQLSFSTSVVTLQGDMTLSGGGLTVGGSTLAFTGGLNQTLTTGGTSFMNVQVSKSGNSLTLSEDLSVLGNLTVTLGTLNTSGNNYSVSVSSDVLINGGTLTLNSSTMSVGGAWARTLGTFNANFSTITFNSSTAKAIRSGGQSFSHLDFSGSGSWALQDQLSATGNLSLTNGTVNTSATNYGILVSSDVRLNGGTFTLNNSTVIVTGNWTTTAGTLNANSSTITFNSAGAKTILSSEKSFAHLVFSGAGSWTLQDQLTTAGNLTATGGTLNTSSNNYGILVSSDVLINGGTLTLNSSTMAVTGAWVRTSGTFNPNSSTVTFNSAATKAINIGTLPFNNVLFNGTGQWNLTGALFTSGNLTLTNGTLNTGANLNMTVGGSVYLNGGTFTLNNSSMSVAEDWSRASTVINPGGSTVTFTGASDANLTGSSTFYSLTCVTAGKNLTFESNSTQTVTGLLTLTGANGNPIILRASDLGTYAYLKNSGGNNVTYVDVQDSNASAGVTIRNFIGGVNQGHNINWSFTDSSRYWIASSPAFWNSTANWSLTSGGSGGASVPGSTHTVVFDGVNGKNGNATVNTPFTITTMTISGYSGLVDIYGYSVTIASALNQSSGQLSLSTSVVTLQGDMTLSGGGLTVGGSTLAFTGGLNQTLTTGGTSFMNVQVSKSGNSLTLSEDLSVLGNLTVTLGTLNTSGSNYSVSVSSDVLINGGTLTLNNSTMSVGGAWTRSLGNFNANSSTVTFNSAATKTINIGTLPFAHVEFNGAGQWNLAGALYTSGNLTLTNGTLNTGANFNITVGSNVYLTGGTFTLNSSSMSIKEDWSRTSTVVNPGGSTVTFTSSLPSQLTGSNTFYSLTSIIAGKNLTFESNSTQTVTGLLTLTGGVGNPILLRASIPGIYAYFKSPVTHAVSYVDVQDSNATAGATIRDFTGGVNQGNNINWSFADSTRYWIASSPAFWNSTANWSLTSGGSGGATVPGSTHTVVFDGVNNSNGNATVNTAFTITTMTISGYTGLLNIYGYGVTISSNLTQSSGQLSFSTSVVTLQGDMNLSGGGFTAGGSTLSFTGSVSQTLTSGGTSFANVQISKGANSVTLADDLIAMGNLSVTLGTLNTSGSNYSVTVASDVFINGGTLKLNSSTMAVSGSWTKSTGVFDDGNSTVTFTGGLNQTLTSGSTSFFNLEINKSAGSLIFSGAVNVDGSLTQTAGTLNTSSVSVAVAGNWTHTAGTLTIIGSTVTFDGAGTSTLSGSTTFYGLIAQNSSTILAFEAGTTFYVMNMVDLRNVSLKSTQDNATWYFNLARSSQTLIGLTVQDSNAYGGLTLLPDSASIDNGNNRNWVFATDFRYWVGSVSGFWNNTANWSRASGGSGGATVPSSTHTVVFDGANGKNGTATVNTNVTITTLTISGYTGLLNFYGYNITISSNLTQSSGQLALSTSIVTLQGDMTRTGGGFTAGESTISFTGGLNQTLTPGGTSFANVQINKSASVNVVNLGGDMIAMGNLTVTVGTLNTTNNNYSLTVTSDVLINGGTLQLNNSTMAVSGNWTKSAGTFDDGGSTVTFTGGTTQTLTSGSTSFFNLAVNKSAGSLIFSGAVNIDGSFTQTAGTVNTSSVPVSVAENWTYTSGNLNVTGTTVTFDGSTNSSLIGSTTFYGFRSSSSGLVLRFSAGTTFYVSNMIDLGSGVSLKSTQDGSPWYLSCTASSRTISTVTVRDSNANGGFLLQAPIGSTDLGNNFNWDFGAPAAIANLNALISSIGGSVNLTWDSPGDDGSNTTLNNSTFTIQYTTATAFAQSSSWNPNSDPQSYVYRVNLATNNVTAGSAQGTTISNLIDGGTYYFRAWTKDDAGNYATISNGATNWITVVVLGIHLSTDTLRLGSLTAGTTVVYSSSITVTNTGNVTSRYQLNLTEPGIWHSTTNPAGIDLYRLTGIFKNTIPAESDFSAANDALTVSVSTASATSYAVDADPNAIKGFSVAPGEERGLWFRIEMPPISSTDTEQVIRFNASPTQ